MKLSTINQVVESILETDNPKAKVVANEAVIYWKTFFIAEKDGIDKAMEYFKGNHSEDEYQEYRTSVVGEPALNASQAAKKAYLTRGASDFDTSLDKILMGVWHTGYNRCNTEKNHPNGYDNYSFSIEPEQAQSAIKDLIRDMVIGKQEPANNLDTPKKSDRDREAHRNGLRTNCIRNGELDGNYCDTCLCHHADEEVIK